jgi:hypothetical protein
MEDSSLCELWRPTRTFLITKFAPRQRLKDLLSKATVFGENTTFGARNQPVENREVRMMQVSGEAARRRC